MQIKEINIPIRWTGYLSIGKNKSKKPLGSYSMSLQINTKWPVFIAYLYCAWKMMCLAVKSTLKSYD
ncbi:MAG: hypothetical protein ACOC80_12790 [Petrotogales bacterium]